MLNRRQTIVGYATYVVARRLARRTVRRKLEGLRSADGVRVPWAGANGTDAAREKGGRMLRKTTAAGRAGAQKTKAATSAGASRASALIEAFRPLIERAASDQQLHEAIRNAFATGREVSAQLSGKKPSKAARKLADDRKLQRRAMASATQLRDALSNVAQERKRRRGRKVLGVVAAIAALAAVVPFLRNRLGGGNGEDGDQDSGF